MASLDGLTLGFLARELNGFLQGGRIDRISQPFSDMVVLNLYSQGNNYRLLISASPECARIHLTEKTFENPIKAPMFLMLLRKHLLGGRILSIQQLNGDRILRIDVSARSELGDESMKTLYFEAMGRYTNLTLVDNGIIIDAARRVSDDMSRVRTILPGLPFIMPPGQDKIAPENATKEALMQKLSGQTGKLDSVLAGVVSGLSMQSARELAYRAVGEEGILLATLPLEELCESLSKLLCGLPSLYAPQLNINQEGNKQEALPFCYYTKRAFMEKPTDTLSEAVETAFDEGDRRNRQRQRTQSLMRIIENAQKRAENRIHAQEEELANAARMEEFRISGELLTAFSHLVEKGADKAELPDYYNENRPRVISLDSSLSPAQNAQRYFKKYRKANVARKMVAEQMEIARKDLEFYEQALYFLSQAQTEEDLSAIRGELYEAGLIKKSGKQKQAKQSKPTPMKFVSTGGFTILVGKNSSQNEHLLRTSSPEDWWLHAKDIAGSHVIVKSQGKEVDEQTLLEAAKLAGFYSKGKGQGVAVDVTLRRYVKKIPGGTPGAVTFTNNHLLIVDVKEEEIKSLEA
jgi:predicted ribosome quality control (RQC) complex YloA/Tae2 family protein